MDGSSPGWNRWPSGTAQYLAFVTALTIGYGDLSPESAPGKFVCIALGIIGMIWVGLIVGVASVAVRRTVETKPNS